MLDHIIAGVLLVIFLFAIFRTRKHFRGGGCCGSGSNTIRECKTLTEPKIGEKVLSIEGMHCENCAIRVENALNRLDGVLCKINLRKKTATVSYSKEVSDELLKQAVEELGYQVKQIG